MKGFLCAFLAALVCGGLVLLDPYGWLHRPDEPLSPVPMDGNMMTFTTNGVSFTMVRVPGGTFTMGSTDEYAGDDEKITHSVTLSDYYIGETEVTQALWEAVMGSNPSYFKGAKLPVEKVSWEDICGKDGTGNDPNCFLYKLRKATGQQFKLPTEAQWEYAARGGQRTSLYSGEDITILGDNNSPNLDRLAWYGGNCGQNYTSSAGCDVSHGYDISGWPGKQYNDSKGGTHPVKMKQPNAYGLYDMLGNVWEWCSDWYGSSSGYSRVLRGGSWGDFARRCRVSVRVGNTPSRRIYDVGLRLAL